MKIAYYINRFKELSLKNFIKKAKRHYFGDWLCHRQVLKELRKNYSYIYKDYTSYSHKEQIHKEFYIWIMWWQGKDQMPDIIKICYQSIIAASKGCNVRLITKYNIKKYINLPSIIFDKYEQKIIPIAQFSDIIRFGLLYKYGGLWIDSTTLVTNYQLINLRNRFFTLKFKTKSQATPTKGRWAITILSGNEKSIFFNYMYKLLIEYWKKENKLLKYFLTDYFILLLYRDCPIIKSSFEKVEWNKSNYTLKEYINRKFNKNHWNKLIRKTHFHTLSRKNRYVKKNKNGALTYYGYLTEKYKINEK